MASALGPGEESAQRDQRKVVSAGRPTSAGFPFLVERELPSQEQVFGDDLRARS